MIANMGWRGASRVPLRLASIIALLIALAVSAAATWGARLTVHDQERRLLKERTAEVGLVLTSAIDSLQTTLSQHGAILRATHGSAAAYEQAAATDIGPRTPVSPTYAWLRPGAGGTFIVVAAAGDALRAGDVVRDARAGTMAEALRVQKMVATSVIGRQRLLGFALGPPAAPAGTVLFRQATLGSAISPPRQVGTTPFSELDVALYGTTTAQPAQVLTATTSHLPLRGDERNQQLIAGATPWLLSVKARVPLVGNLTWNAPWLILGAGVLGSLLIAAVIETAARRRDAALALYAAEHHVAETLQRSLLPQLPTLAGLDIAARYLASGAGQHVGGDWFDVFPVADGRVGLVVGDVIGHDLTAASAMAQIRAALRAYAVDGDSPARVIARLERLVEALQLTQLVTVVYGVLEPPAVDGSRLLRYTNAGHLPPMLRTASGRVDMLSGGASVVIGAPIASEHVADEHVLEPGSTLLMFTDGLVEVPGESLDDALQRLAVTVAERDGTDAEAMCDHVLSVVSLRALRDDVALLAVRVAEPQVVPAAAKRVATSTGSG